jgi:hypothetical protein
VTGHGGDPGGSGQRSITSTRGDQQEVAGRHEVHQWPALAIGVLDFCVRQRRPWPRARNVDADLVDRGRSRAAVGDDRPRRVGVAVFDIVLAELHRLARQHAQHLAAVLGVLGPPSEEARELRPIGVGAGLRVEAERLPDANLVERVGDRPLDVAAGYGAALGLVAVEQK